MNPPTDVTTIFTQDILRLENICLVTVATKIWDTPFFKREIASCYKRRVVDRYFSIEEQNSQAKHSELEKRILYDLKQLPLPPKVMAQLEEVVFLIGCRFSEHICYVTSSLNLDISHVDQVYWTPYGTINKDKIYEFWKKIPSFTDASVNITWSGMPLIYYMAAVFVDEKFIDENCNSIIEKIESNHPEIKIGQDHNKICNIISVLIYLYQFCKVPINYLGNAYVNIPAMDMFQTCYKANYMTATEYFWKILNENGDHLISDLIDIENPIMGETLYFLIRKMSLEERNNFLRRNIYLSRRLAHDWPFSKLLLAFYDSDLVDPEQYCLHFLHHMMHVAWWKCRFPAKNKLLVKSFTKIWNKLSITDKLNIVKVKAIDSVVDGLSLELLSKLNWYDLMNNFHFQCLRVIVNDKDLQSYRSVMDAALVKILLHWVDKDDPDGRKQINIFMNEVLISDVERKKMENELNLAVRKKYSLPSTVNYTDIQGRSTLFKLGGSVFI